MALVGEVQDQMAEAKTARITNNDVKLATN
jgi:hypothetical protein